MRWAFSGVTIQRDETERVARAPTGGEGAKGGGWGCRAKGARGRPRSICAQGFNVITPIKPCLFGV